MFLVTFWGVRGSVPAPLTGTQVAEKARRILRAFRDSGSPEDINAFVEASRLSIPIFGTYGGNTSCVDVVTNEQHRLVLDMGTGIRGLGMSLFPAMFQKRGLEIDFLLSHVHWDHIHGLPFFGPLYVNKGKGIRNRWKFHGGTDWQATAEMCLQGQMDPPTFPVSWREIIRITESLQMETVCDMLSFQLLEGVGPRVYCRKLNHPQETYGYRIVSNGAVIAYTTDNEPYDPNFPDPPLLEIAKNADVWITDCQYTKDVYEGKVGGLSRHGWGHSYPEAIARTAVEAGVKGVYLFHHDPASTDDDIKRMEEYTQKLIREQGGRAEVTAAYEGLVVHVPDATNQTLIPGQLMAPLS